MEPIDPVDPGLTGLHRPVAAGVFPVLAEGERIWIQGTASRAGVEIGSGSLILATVSAAGLGTAANVLLFPGVVRRDFTSPSGTSVETLLATPTLPLAILQWSAPPGPLEVRLPGAPASSAQIRNDGVSVGDARFEVVLTPSAEKPVVSEAEDGLRVVLQPAAEGPTTLVMAFGEEALPPAFPGLRRRGSPRGGGAPASRYVAAARHAGTHALRAADGPREGLLLNTGIPEVDEAVRWLRARVAGQARRLGDNDPRRALSVGLACAAVGDAVAAEAAVVSLPPSSAGHALLAARLAATSGDARHALRAAGHWVDDGRDGQEGSSLAARAVRELADALHLTGDPETIARLRGRSEALQDATASGSQPTEANGIETTTSPSRPDDGVERRRSDEGTPARRLPMVRGGGRPAETRWWDGLLDGAPPILPDSFLKEPDAAWIAWRQLLAGGLEGEPPDAGPTLWDSPGSGETSRTAELLLALAVGLLGLQPDAAVGRLTMAPRLPSHLTRFEAVGIPLGSSALRLLYVKEAGRLRYEIVPEVATVPPLLVFEPSVAGTVSRVLVDGEAADLDVRREGGRSVIPVQLPLDQARVVEIAVE